MQSTTQCADHTACLTCYDLHFNATAHLNCVPRSLTNAWPSQAAVKRGTSAASRKRRYARECSSSLALQICWWCTLETHANNC